MGYRNGDETVVIEDARKVGPASAKAELFEINGVEMWLPKSQCYGKEGPYGDDLDMYELVVSQWWAGKNGL